MNNWPAMRHRRTSFLPGRPQAGWRAIRLADETWGPARTVDRPRFTSCFFALVLGGRGRLRSDGQEAELLPGCCFAMLAGHDHRIAIERDLHLRIAVGQGEELASAAEAIAPGLPAIWHPPRTACIESLLEELLLAAEEGGPQAAHLADEGLRLLVALLRHAPQRPPGGTAAATFAACRETIARHALALEGVGDAAERCGLDRAYLARLFRRHGGESPSDFLLRHKMRRAAEELAAGSTIADCAIACGYRNPDVFSRAFRRHFGHTPSRWRHQLV